MDSSGSHRRFSAVVAGPKSSEKPFKRFPGLVRFEMTRGVNEIQTGPNSELFFVLDNLEVI